MSVPSLRVAVNLLWVAPGRVGGSEQYLERQLLGLSDPDLDVTLFCAGSFRDAHPDLTAARTTVVAPGGRDWRAGRIAAEHTWLALRTRSADVVHHGGGTAPLVGRRPFVLTLHDLQYRSHPGYFGRPRRAYLGAMVPRSVRRAAVVAVPSDYVRGTVVDAFDADPERVVVVPHGIPSAPSPRAAAVAEVERRIGGRPYVVYPAITHPHKGHRLLIEMLAHLDADVHLVLIGGQGAVEAEVRAAIGGSGQGERVHRLGRVGDDERDAWLAGAAALVFPSEYEGFGAPLVEAMSLGTPVVCSDAPAVVEVVGDAGVVVTERSGAAWAEGVVTAIGRRDELVGLGRVRRERFTGATSGAALAACYRLAAEVGVS